MIPASDVEAAAARIRGKVRRTPLVPALREGLFLKCELFQPTGSFKVRGALNKVLTLPEAERRKGLVTVSAGNHAMAVAWAAAQVSASCVVVMPADAPKAKLEGVKALGAEVVAHGDRATLFDRMEGIRRERGLTLVHPFDDPAVAAGAGTQALEVLEDLPDADTLVIPIGGGGTLAGAVPVVLARKPGLRIVAVELEEGPALGPAMKAGKPVTVGRPYGTLADGMVPPYVGALTVEAALRKLDQLVTVTEEEIRDAMRRLLTGAKLAAEGSGAAAAAAVLSGKVRGDHIVALVSGGNVDPGRLMGLFAS